MAEEKEEATEKKGGKGKLIIIIVVLLLLIGGGVGGTLFFLKGEEPAEGEVAEGEGEAGDKSDPPMYYSVDPKFVVSFSDQTSARFMQFSLEVMSRDTSAGSELKTHMPVIRSNLLMRYGSQKYEQMSTREGKEALLKESVEDINNSIQKANGWEEPKPLIEEAYFTSFVIQ